MKKWPNLIREVEPSRPDEVWVSDITYIEVMRESTKNFLYLSLVTDAFTHEIVGYSLHDSLDTTGPLRALNMALSKYPAGTLRGLIHHSDRGGSILQLGVCLQTAGTGHPDQHDREWRSV